MYDYHVKGKEGKKTGIADHSSDVLREALEKAGYGGRFGQAADRPALQRKEQTRQEFGMDRAQSGAILGMEYGTAGMGGIRKHRMPDTGHTHTIVQMMRLAPFAFDENECFETTDLATDDLSGIIAYDSYEEGGFPLTLNGRAVLEKIIADRGENPICEFETAYGVSGDALQESERISDVQLGCLQKSRSFLTSLTSANEAVSLTSKKNRRGAVRKLDGGERKSLHRTVEEFYRLAQSIPPAEHEIALYRGISIDKSEDLRKTIREYSEVLPCSTSFGIRLPLQFAGEGSMLKDSLVIKLLVPARTPLVSLSFPNVTGDEEQMKKAINQSQEEVLLGAYRVSRIVRIDVMNRVPEDGEEPSRLILAIVRIMPMDEGEVHQHIEDSQKAPARILALDEAGIRRTMHDTCKEELVKLLKGQESKYAVGKSCIDVDENGPYIINQIADGRIEFEDRT